MRVEKIDIKVGDAKAAVLTLYLQTDYAMYQEGTVKPMMLICPGGGYEHVSPREGEPIALQFLAGNCHAAVLWYDVDKETVFPQHLMELAKAVAIIRENAKEYMVDPDKIIVAGFSAGGHLAASLGCFWQEDFLKEKMAPLTPKDYQPNGLMLAYPVITSGEFAHRGSFNNLLGSKANDKDALDFVSLEKHVTKNVPPVFMWHTFEDGAVPLENSLLFAGALRKADVNLEYHVFPHGGHGYALATKETLSIYAKELDPQIPQWINLAKKWIEINF